MSAEKLFPRPSQEFLALMAALPGHLDAAMPMRKQHRRELPGDIRHLSHLLTDERGDLRRDYLADPAALSAYMRYFLPWNIHRLGILFAGLALDPGGDNPDGETTIVDLGTGPLTAPLALWMSRPHLRRRKLTFICVDRAPKPMRLGLDALTHMAAGRGGLAPWRVKLVKGPLDARLREKADLLIVANALNEVLHRGEDADLLQNADALAWHLSSMLTPTGSLCVVEPGVRPSAHLLAALRRGFMHQGLKPLAPCPHSGPCPMSGRGYTAWCHFNFESDTAPAWLKRLSEDARLTKDNVSLSFLHFSARGRTLAPAEGKLAVRAVSGPFELPARSPEAPRAFGQYACSELGLTLLTMPKKHLLPLPGTLLDAPKPAAPETDAKSGAAIVPLGAEHTFVQAEPAAKDTAEAAQAPAQKDAQAPDAPREPARTAPRLPSQRPAESKRGGKAAARPASKSGPKPGPKSPAARPAKPAGSNPASPRPASPRPAGQKPAKPARKRRDS